MPFDYTAIGMEILQPDSPEPEIVLCKEEEVISLRRDIKTLKQKVGRLQSRSNSSPPPIAHATGSGERE